jgi:hypothetical protein
MIYGCRNPPGYDVVSILTKPPPNRPIIIFFNFSFLLSAVGAERHTLKESEINAAVDYNNNNNNITI